MVEFFAAIGFFLFAHIVPPIPPVRRCLIGVAGRRIYLIAYSMVSLALFAWVIAAAQRAPYVMLWAWAPWQAVVPLVLMPFAAWLLIAGLYEPNDLSISLRSNGGVRLGNAASVTRHPVLLGFFLWAASHIPANGDLVSLILFGFVAGFSVLGVFSLDRRARRRLGPDQWQRLSQQTSIVPFAALLAGRSKIDIQAPLASTAIAALIFYLWFLFQGHALLIGVDPTVGL